jgi:hypothetical protein
VLLFSGCFDPEPTTPGGDDLGGVESSDTDVEESPTDSAGDLEGGTADETDGSEVPPGPQLVRSLPADGDQHASLSPSFQLYFDRIVSPNDAVGNLWVSQDGGMAQPVSPLHCEPDSDPTCIAAELPEAFREAITGRLPGASTIEITVRADFADPEGNVGTSDQTASFRTFPYEASFYDDSETIDTLCGGIAHDPGTESLFFVGAPGGYAFIRRVPIPGGVPGVASTVAMPTGAYYIDGLEVLGDRLYAPGASTANIYLYENLAAADLMATEDIVTTTGLPAPLDTFTGVWSVAQVGGLRYYAHESAYLEGSSPILRFDGVDWSVFLAGAGLWEHNESVVVAGRSIDGVDYLFASAGTHLYRIDVASGAILTQIEREDLQYGTDIELDSKGRLWIGTWNQLVVLDGKTADLRMLADRSDIAATKLALREDGTAVHAYFHSFYGPCLIGHVAIQETELQ